MQYTNTGDIINILNVSCLYKYLKISHSFPTVDNLLTIRLSSPSLMNDPFEFLIGKIETITKEQADDFVKREGLCLKKSVSGINKFFNDNHEKILNDQYNVINSHIRISSFSTENSNLLMWSHYADYHKGFVIEYDMETMISRMLDENLPICLAPIIYSSDMPSISNLLFVDESKRSEEMNKITCTKAQCWNYENEWRLIISQLDKKMEDKENIDLPVQPSEIKSIYFGVRCPQDEINRIRSITEDLRINCSLFRATINKEHYKLDFTTI